MKNILLPLAFLLIGTVSSQSQDFTSDITRINTATDAGGWKLNVSTVIRNLENNDEVSASYTYCLISINHYWLSSKAADRLVTPELCITVSHANNTVMLDSMRGRKNKPLSKMYFDTLYTHYKRIEYTDLENGKGRYLLEPKKGTVHNIVIDFDKSTYYITRLEHNYYDPQVQAEVRMVNTYRYSELKPGDIPRPHEFYATGAYGRIYLQPEYEDFELINYLHF